MEMFINGHTVEDYQKLEEMKIKENKTPDEWLEFIGAQEGQSWCDFFLEQECASECLRALDRLCGEGRLVYVPILAGTSGWGSYCLPTSPRLPELRREHREWNARFPDSATTLTKEFAETD